MIKNLAKQKPLFELENTGKKPIYIVCEPACSEYELQPKSKIVFWSEVGAPRDGTPPIIAEHKDDRLTIWFEEALYDPDAEIDGKRTEPFSWMRDAGA
jgi:hypothetical protein